MRNLVKLLVDSIIFFEAFFVISEKHPGEKRILIFRKDGLGDCLIFYPTIHSYREFYREAKITLIFPNIFKSLASILTEVDEVIWFDHNLFRTSFFYRRNFILSLKKRGYDVVLYPVYSKEKIAERMIKSTKSPKIITFDNVSTQETSELNRYLDFTEYVTGVRPEIRFPSISVDTLPYKNFDLVKPYVVIFPGTSVAKYRRWPSDRFAKIIEIIIGHDLIPIICGSVGEKELAEEITSEISPNLREKIVDLSGQTDFADLAHILKKAEFYFGSDTGALHLAVAVGTPTIAIVGVGGLNRFFPYGNLSLNRAVFDERTLQDPLLGTWTDTDKLPPNVPHPSIENISIVQVSKEIDYMVKFVNKNN